MKLKCLWMVGTDDQVVFVVTDQCYFQTVFLPDAEGKGFGQAGYRFSPGWYCGSVAVK